MVTVCKFTDEEVTELIMAIKSCDGVFIQSGIPAALRDLLERLENGATADSN